MSFGITFRTYRETGSGKQVLEDRFWTSRKQVLETRF
jgi:hypothetical protein